MAVTADSLAVALGLATQAALDASPRTDATTAAVTEAGRLLSVATSLVDAYLRSADHTCPDAVYDEAVIRTAGHVMNRAGFGRVEGRLEVGEGGGLRMNVQPAARSAVRQSGAAALLAPWVVRTA